MTAALNRAAEALRTQVAIATDPKRGVPFDSEHDTAIVAAWIDELRDDLTKEPA